MKTFLYLLPLILPSTFLALELPSIPDHVTFPENGYFEKNGRVELTVEVTIPIEIVQAHYALSSDPSNFFQVPMMAFPGSNISRFKIYLDPAPLYFYFSVIQDKRNHSFLSIDGHSIARPVKYFEKTKNADSENIGSPGFDGAKFLDLFGKKHLGIEDAEDLVNASVPRLFNEGNQALRTTAALPENPDYSSLYMAYHLFFPGVVSNLQPVAQDSDILHAQKRLLAKHKILREGIFSVKSIDSCRDVMIFERTLPLNKAVIVMNRSGKSRIMYFRIFAESPAEVEDHYFPPPGEKKAAALTIKNDLVNMRLAPYSVRILVFNVKESSLEVFKEYLEL